ncbi:hypothetical protein LL912_24175 [Niabella sp. CC-SYL272]|uniref:hypothetical protein n=1 Tax=Niabella agricola TaxID=2891571 RepID=UPI001F2ED4AC|nr:hypothetical protein [Niabella agricola]MCF3111907.1 hypothetical protein [Niabella agricola]
MKILILMIATVLLGSCNTPSKDASGQTDSINGMVTSPDTNTTTPGTQQHEAHDTSTWEGAPNDSGR